MALAPLDPQQMAEAREWAAKLGVPEADVIADAQAAKDEGYREAASAAHARDQAAADRIASAGGGQMYPGAGPAAEIEAMQIEAEAG